MTEPAVLAQTYIVSISVEEKESYQGKKQR